MDAFGNDRSSVLARTAHSVIASAVDNAKASVTSVHFSLGE
jgi:hypothetical protein